MFYGAGYCIEFDRWKSRSLAGKVNDDVLVRKGTDEKTRARIGRRRTTHHLTFLDIMFINLKSASQLVTHPPPSFYALSDSPDLIIYIILSGSGTGYVNSPFFRLARSRKTDSNRQMQRDE